MGYAATYNLDLAILGDVILGDVILGDVILGDAISCTAKFRWWVKLIWSGPPDTM